MKASVAQMLQVFSFLDQRSLCELAMVCRQWRAAIEHEDFWKALHFGRNITQEQGMCQNGNYIYFLHYALLTTYLVHTTLQSGICAAGFLKQLN